VQSAQVRTASPAQLRRIVRERPEVAGAEALRAAERRLQRAQLTSDVAALDRLIDDRLVVGGTGVTWFLGTLEGTVAGEPFLARVRYTRTWINDDKGWRLIAAHVSPAPAGPATEASHQ